MGNCFNDLLAEVTKADKAEHDKRLKMEYALHRKSVLDLEGGSLWSRFIDSCHDATSELNKSIALKFPHDENKLVAISDPESACLTLNGKSPTFTMSITYEVDQHKIVFSGSRMGSSRQFTLLMDLDETGRPCLVCYRADSLNTTTITPRDAALFLLRLSMAASPPRSPAYAACGA
jgi:hypothetical protein